MLNENLDFIMGTLANQLGMFIHRKARKEHEKSPESEQEETSCARGYHSYQGREIILAYSSLNFK